MSGKDGTNIIRDAHKRGVKNVFAETCAHYLVLDERMKVTDGFSRTTLSRGRVIVDNYQFCGENGCGRFLPRKTAGKL